MAGQIGPSCISAYQAASNIRITVAAISRPTAKMPKIPESRFDRYTDGLVYWICKQQILNRVFFLVFVFGINIEVGVGWEATCLSTFFSTRVLTLVLSLAAVLTFSTTVHG